LDGQSLCAGDERDEQKKKRGEQEFLGEVQERQAEADRLAEVARIASAKPEAARQVELSEFRKCEATLATADGSPYRVAGVC
jgi:hypothetical protein